MTTTTATKTETTIPTPAPTLASEHSLATSGDEAAPEVTDADMWRVIMTGATVGTVGVFLLALGMGLAAGVGLGNAAGMSVLPALFCGVYAGGAPRLLITIARHEAESARRLV